MEATDQTAAIERHLEAELPESDESRVDGPFLYTEDPWVKSCVLTLGRHPTEH
jgi:hypothetical protein